MMLLDEFREYAKALHRMTVDFANAVPDAEWDFTPDPARFGPFSKQLRHVVRARGVYNAALTAGRLDWSRSHEHYVGGLAREPLLVALGAKEEELWQILDTVDVETLAMEWGGAMFTFTDFTWEFVQHEAIHHGQWSVYAALAGFETPRSWQQSWKL